MFGIVYSGSDRNHVGSSWWVRALAYSLSAMLAAGAAGAILGAVGSAVSVDGRAAVASAAAVLAIAVGALDLGPRSLPVIQRDRETSQRGMRTHPLRWTLRNGAMLGIGATSRIGFWLWYLVPVGALLVGRPALGGIIYGVYGGVRGGSVWLLLLGLRGRASGGDPIAWLLGQRGMARRLAAAHLPLVGAAVAVAIGF